MYNNNKILVVIPVIKSSISIPGVFTHLIDNKPLIYYSIEAAKSSEYVDDVVITTDDSEIALICEKLGASVIRRSANESEDEVPFNSIIYDAMIQKEKQAFDEYDIVITIQPTSPLLKTGTLNEAIENFDDFDIESVIGVVEDTHYSWGYDQNNDRFFPNYIERLDKKDLPKSFKETGAILASRRAFVRENAILGNSIKLLVLSHEESITVDYPEDLMVVGQYIQKKRIAFVVRANNEIGTSHIDNCLSIASKLIANEFLFVLDEHDELSIKILNDAGYPYKVYDGFEELYSILRDYSAQIIVNDILNTSQEYMSALNDEGYFVINFDDLGVGSELADIVFDSLEEHDSANEYNVLSGPKYYVLKDEFYFQPPKVITQIINNVLIIFEDNDVNHLSIKVLDAILSTVYENKINIIVGLGYEGIEEFISKYESNPLVQIYQNVSDVSEFMFKADIIITSAGKTIFDACSLGVPTICICQNDLEKTHSFANEDNGFINMGLADALTSQDIASQFIGLVNDYNRRLEMNEKMLAVDLKHGFENINFIVEEKYRNFKRKK